MTGRRYYITTLADWQRHAHRFTNSHWLALSATHANEDEDARRVVMIIEHEPVGIGEAVRVAAPVGKRGDVVAASGHGLG